MVYLYHSLARILFFRFLLAKYYHNPRLSYISHNCLQNYNVCCVSKRNNMNKLKYQNIMLNVYPWKICEKNTISIISLLFARGRRVDMSIESVRLLFYVDSCCVYINSTQMWSKLLIHTDYGHVFILNNSLFSEIRRS